MPAQNGQSVIPGESVVPLMKHRWFLSLALCAPLAGCSKEAPPPPPPPAVEVVTVKQEDVPVYVEAIGQTLGSVEIDIRARVEGFLESIDFASGTYVKAGDLLFTIDPKPFEASLARAKGDLAAAESQHVRAANDVIRYKPLVEQNAISQQEYDNAVALERSTSAAVDAARAQQQGAEYDLSYTKVTSPIAGLVGDALVDVGSLVGRGQNTLLTTVSAIDPIQVKFSISESDYLRFAKRNVERGQDPNEKQQSLPFQLVLSDGSTHPYPGRLDFANNVVDPGTGTLLLQATFPNPDRVVRPGQYGRVRAAVEQHPGALLVPQRAVRELQATFSVAVVDPDGKATFRTVKPGARIGKLWVIESGLAPGDKVVVEGLQKVKDGQPVAATEVEIEPDAQAAPAAGGSAPAPAGS